LNLAGRQQSPAQPFGTGGCEAPLLSFDAIAGEAGPSKRRVQQVFDLAFLVPDTIRDIINGTQTAIPDKENRSGLVH